MQALYRLAAAHGGLLALSGAALIAMLVLAFSRNRTRKEREALIKRLNEKDRELEDLRTRERDLSRTLGNLPFVIFAADATGVIKLVDGQGTEAFGSEMVQCKGRRIAEVGAANPQFCAHAEKALRGRPFACLEHSGGQFLSVHHLPVTDDGGEVTGVLGLAINIGGHHAGSAGLSANVKSFAAGLTTHVISPFCERLRKPISTVAAVTEPLLQSNLEPEVQQCLEVLMFSSRSIQEALTDAQDMVELETGNLKLMSAGFSLREVLEDSLTPFARHAGNAGRHVEWRLRSQVPDAYVGDACRLRQVLYRLVSYLMESVASPGVCVDVQIGSSEAEVAELSFTISNSGREEARSGQPLRSCDTTPAGCIHDKYGQVPDARLDLAEGLIRMMGGRLILPGVLGDGTPVAFSVRLKKKPDSLPGLDRKELSDPLPRCRLNRLSPATEQTPGAKPIMVAGFKDQAQANLIASLEDRGHSVRVVGDEREMLALLEKCNWGGFQLIVLGREGLQEDAEELAAFVGQQAREAGNHLPVLMIPPKGSPFDFPAFCESLATDETEESVDELRIAKAVDALCGVSVEQDAGQRSDRLEVEANR